MKPKNKKKAKAIRHSAKISKHKKKEQSHKAKKTPSHNHPKHASTKKDAHTATHPGSTHRNGHEKTAVRHISIKKDHVNGADHHEKSGRKLKINANANKIIYMTLFVLGIALLVRAAYVSEAVSLFMGLLVFFLALFLFLVSYRSELGTKHRFYPILLALIIFLAFFSYALKDMIIEGFNSPLSQSWIIYLMAAFILADMFLIIKHDMKHSLKEARSKAPEHHVEKKDHKPKETKLSDAQIRKKKFYKKITLISLVLAAALFVIILVFKFLNLSSVRDYLVLIAILAAVCLAIIIPKMIRSRKAKKSKETIVQKEEPKLEQKEEIEDNQDTAQEAPADDDLIKVLRTVDELLGELPQERIEQFANSEDFKAYEKVLNRYNIK